MLILRISGMIAFFLWSNLFAQEEELPPEKIKTAKIKSLTTTTFQVNSEGGTEKIKTERFEYDPQGKLVRRMDFGKGDFPETSTQIRYDERGNKIFQELIRHKEKDTLNVTWTYRYEDNKMVAMYNSNTPVYKTYQYDTAGRLIEEKDVDPSGKIIATHTWHYNDQGLLAEEIQSQEFLTRIYNWQYNEAGKKTIFYFTRKHTFEGETTTREKETYEYNSQGQLAKLLYYNPSGQLESFIRYYYDPQGLLIREEAGETEYAYKYDQRGNLTEKKKTVRGKVPGFVRNSYEFR
ncbi:MAG: hypothetical protein SF052_22490 [Bacteroidia bacterium]|nr:hypothetical protein [Bacteroidia bacterium]